MEDIDKNGDGYIELDEYIGKWPERLNFIPDVGFALI